MPAMYVKYLQKVIKFPSFSPIFIFLQVETNMSLWCDPVQKSIVLFPQTVLSFRVLVQSSFQSSGRSILKQSSFPRAMRQDRRLG